MPRPKKTKPPIKHKKVEIQKSTERTFKVQCLLAGRTEQEVIGSLIHDWTLKQEKKK